MTAQSWLTLAIVIGVVVLLVSERFPTAVVVMGGDVVLLILGVISPEQALSGFSNPAPVTVAALFIVARAVQKTGAIQPLLENAVGRPHNGRRGLLRLLVPVTATSAFLNNTAIVAMLAPPVTEWAEKHDCSPSTYLMPLSFATILGGTVTLIGTSTNLVASGLMTAHGMPPLGMFELTPVGLPIALTGLVVLVALSPSILPARRTARREFEQHKREFVYQTIVERGGPYDGRTVEQAGLRNLHGVFLVEVERDGELIAPAAPATHLRAGDCLTFAGRVDMIRDLQGRRGLRTVDEQAIPFAKSGHTFFEAVIGGGSDLVGKTLKDGDFRNRYHAAVLAIHRSGQRVNEKLGSVRIREGDTLLIVSDDGFDQRWNQFSNFALVAKVGGGLPVGSRGAVTVGVVTLGIVIIAAIGLLPILEASLLGSILLLLTRVLSPAEARSAVAIDVLVTIAAAFGIGAAMETTGLASRLAAVMIMGAGHWGPIAVLLVITIVTIAVTEVITNNAAAVLLFPIAIAAAESLQVNPRPYLIAVTIAASCSFLTPIGYQTNTMVYGLGGYKFADFARLGFPLTIAITAIIVFLVPVFWHF